MNTVFAGFDLLSFTDIEHIYGFFRQPGDSKEATACLWCCSEKKVRRGRYSPVWLLQQPCQLGEGLGQQSCTYWECDGMFKVSTDLLHHMNHIPAVAWTKEKQNINVLFVRCVTMVRWGLTDSRSNLTQEVLSGETGTWPHSSQYNSQAFLPSSPWEITRAP